MADNNKTERKVRSISTTFDLKDVAVVAIAAFTAAGPFFAYDTRISVVETHVEQIQEDDAKTEQLVKEVAQDLKAHLKEYEQETLNSTQPQQKKDEESPPQK